MNVQLLDRRPRFLLLGAALLMTALLSGCGEPLPADKANYAGTWRAPNMLLHITKDGSVEYKRRGERGNVSINAPIQRFEGDNFVVGVGPLSTTFVVTKPPHADGAVWRMTVDGVDLVRADGDQVQI